MSTIGVKSISLDKIMNDLQSIKDDKKSFSPTEGGDNSNAKSFLEQLQDGLESVNTQMSTADKKATDLAVGKSANLHEVMLASTQAELSFNLMVQLRNKALETYNEIMRMPV